MQSFKENNIQPLVCPIELPTALRILNNSCGGFSFRVLFLCSIVLLILSMSTITVVAEDDVIIGYIDEEIREDNSTNISNNESDLLPSLIAVDKTDFWKFFYSIFVFVIALNVALHFLLYFFNTIFYKLKFIWFLLFSVLSVVIFLFYLSVKFGVTTWNIPIYFYAGFSVLLLLIHYIIDTVNEDLWSAKASGIDGKLLNFFIISLVAVGAMFAWYWVFWLGGV